MSVESRMRLSLRSPIRYVVLPVRNDQNWVNPVPRSLPPMVAPALTVNPGVVTSPRSTSGRPE